MFAAMRPEHSRKRDVCTHAELSVDLPANTTILLLVLLQLVLLLLPLLPPLLVYVITVMTDYLNAAALQRFGGSSRPSAAIVIGGARHRVHNSTLELCVEYGV